MSLKGFFPSWSDMFDPGEVECLNRVNASPQIRAIDGEIDRLTKTWKPTDYFDPQDVQHVIDLLDNELVASGLALAEAPESTSDSEQVKRAAADDAKAIVRDRGLAYSEAVTTAKSAGGVIHAPGFKAYCLASMGAISQVYVTAAVLHCRQTWLQAVLDRAYQVAAAIGDVLAKIGGVIVAVGEAVINAAEAGIGFVATVIKYAPYIGLGIAGLFVYTWVRKTYELGPDKTIHAITSATTRAGKAGWRAGARAKRKITGESKLLPVWRG